MTDDLDRLFERLVRVLASDAPGRLAVPFPAAEVYERLVPYRSNRSTLRVATHQDYEMAVLRLLAGERGYVSLEPTEVQQALQREAGEQNPDTGLFRQFPDAILSLNRLAAERFLRGDRVYAPTPPPPTASAAASATSTRPRVEAGEPEEEVEEDEPEESAASRATSSASPFELAEQTETPRQCPYCGETVPANRKVNFCPQCGQPPSGELRCPACGSEVDVGWRYCVGCGRATGFE
jgi:Double zinc ribbon